MNFNTKKKMNHSDLSLFFLSYISSYQNQLSVSLNSHNKTIKEEKANLFIVIEISIVFDPSVCCISFQN